MKARLRSLLADQGSDATRTINGSIKRCARLSCGLLVPYLPRSITDGAIFLYGSVDEAQSRVGWGGSGFLVGMASEAAPELVHLYAVSNDHVTSRCPVIRLTKANGDVELIPLEPQDWIEHPDGDDVAVCAVGPVPAPGEQFRDLNIPMDAHFYFDVARLLAVEDFAWGVGPSIGDDCLMVGQYINLEGRQFDRGAVRFGNLSMFPDGASVRALV